MRKIRFLALVAAVGALLFTTAPSASADWYWPRTSPYAGVCWNKTTAYGGANLMTTGMVNNTASATKPKLRLVDVANPLVGRGFAGWGVGGSVYLPLMVRGMGAFSTTAAFICG